MGSTEIWRLIAFSIVILYSLTMIYLTVSLHKGSVRINKANEQLEKHLKDIMSRACTTLNHDVIEELFNELVDVVQIGEINQENTLRYWKIKFYLRGKYGGLLKKIHELEK